MSDGDPLGPRTGRTAGGAKRGRCRCAPTRADPAHHSRQASFTSKEIAMSVASETRAPIRNPGSFYIGGQWVTPSTDATIDVVEAATEQVYFQVAEAKEADMNAA